MSMAHTYKELAQTFGTTTEAMRKSLNRAGLEFPGKNAIAEGEPLKYILDKYSIKAPEYKNEEKAKDYTKQRQSKDKVSAKKSNSNGYILYGLTLAPVLASVRNIYRTSADIMQDNTDAIILTYVLTITAPVLVWLGVKGRAFILLLSALILAEIFANTTAIYYGLMGSENGNPVRFIGTVTDIIPVGSANAALSIAVFFAALIAAVQYLTIKEIRK